MSYGSGCYPSCCANYAPCAPCAPCYNPCATACSSPCPCPTWPPYLVSFSAASAGGQVAAVATPVVVSFPVVSVASASYSAASSAFTAPVAGNYLFSTNISWTTLAAPTSVTVSIFLQWGVTPSVLQASQTLTVNAAGTYATSIPGSLIHVPAGAAVFVQFSSTSAATINAGSTFAGNLAACPPTCAAACPC